MKFPKIKNFFHKLISNLYLNLVVLLVLWVALFYPLYPLAWYQVSKLIHKSVSSIPILDSRNLALNHSGLDPTKYNKLRLLEQYPHNSFLEIDKIGVFTPIFNGESSDSEWILEKGVWHYPDTADVDEAGNTVIIGHRFRYLPPSSVTFYLLDKMEKGDLVDIIEKDKIYSYKIKDIKVMEADDWSILAQDSKKRLLTLVTCTPLFRTEKRLVVAGELMEIKEKN